MSFVFTEANEANFAHLLPRYPHPKALVLPCLWMAQYQDTYISMDAMHFIAKKLNVPVAHIYSVATFYTMFNLEPMPKYHIQVCKTLSCELCGKEDIIKAIEEETGLKVNESNEFFKLTQVECLGACAGAPILQLNEDYHENLTPSSTKKLLQRLVL
ncbi:NAD(P)H-dependent oxidoreductase subunit E [Sulfurimonas sp. MAG313]|nr:NAD(P)H-dependent oxidoreductase subunit E [Sulfurimonas sp. MAG313]MDF1881321.1 NAD(P)H-dependent oxidoreductase subunit E [Sulfurimonas sp. MAG313]